MNKKLLLPFFIMLLLFIGAVKYSPTVQKPFLDFFLFIKSSYFSTIESIEASISQHFHQAQTIKELQQQLQKAKKEQLELVEIKTKYKDLLALSQTNQLDIKKLQLVRALSYEKFGDTNRLWLDVQDYNSSKIYGLVYDNAVAGIVVAQNNLPLALLNHDQKSAYAVMIGTEKAPGIAHGNNEKNIVVTYIPAWYNINVGDEVLTSGLDDIFFRGIKVGKVLSVSTAQGYKKAVVEPYFQKATLEYYYMIQR